MNKDLYPPAGNFQATKGSLDLVYTSGASGAIPTTLTRANGIAASGVTHSATGTITVKFDEGVDVFLGGVVTVLPTGAAYDATKAMGGYVVVWVASTRTATFVTTRPDTGAATDTASGDIVIVTFEFLQNGSITT